MLAQMSIAIPARIRARTLIAEFTFTNITEQTSHVTNLDFYKNTKMVFLRSSIPFAPPHPQDSTSVHFEIT